MRSKNCIDYTIAISAGGSGGHVFPAISLASILDKKHCKLEFYTDERGHKWAGKFSSSNIYKIKSRAVLGGSLFSKAISVLSIILGLFTSLKFLLKTRPDVIIGFGGYATVPSLLAAKILNIPIIIHEQNAYSGLANRLLGRFADFICTGFKFPKGLDADKCNLTGNLVRKEISSVKSKIYDGKMLNILITGGSQGAEIFGNVIPKALSKYAGKVSVIQQVKKSQIKKVSKIYKDAKIKHSVTDFIFDMASSYKKSSLIICRSGAGTVTENCAVSIASIMVPYKYASDNHQFYNALTIERSSAGIIIEENNFSVENLQKTIDNIILSDNKGGLASMGKNAFDNYLENADKILADKIIDFLKNNVKNKFKTR